MINSNDKQSVYILAVAIASLLIAFLVRTTLLRVVFASSFLILTLLSLRILKENKNSTTDPNQISVINVKEKHVSLGWLIVLLAFLSSISVLFISVSTSFGDNSFIVFTSLTFSEVLRVCSGIFLVCIFPGSIFCWCFFKNTSLNRIEKFTLTLALSFVLSTLFGLLLSETIGLSPLNFLLVLWGFVLTCKVVGYARNKQRAPDNNVTKTSYSEVILLLSVSLLVIFTSYLLTLMSDPVHSFFSGDISYYLSGSSSFMLTGTLDGSYLWFQVFIGIVSSLTGLPSLYAFVGIQFMIVLFPLAFYTFLIRVFKDGKIAAIGTTITTITGGLSALGILGLFPIYDYTNPNLALWTLRIKTQNWPWLSNDFLIVATVDISLLLLGIGFLYSFIEGQKSQKSLSLLLGSLFLASTIFIHSILSLIAFVILLIVFYLFNHRYLRRILVCLGSILILVVLLNFISFDYFGSILMNYYLTYWVLFDAVPLISFQTVVLLISSCVILLLILLFIPKLIQRAKRKFISVYIKLSVAKFNFICALIAFIFLVLSLILTIMNYNSLNYPDEILFPWYLYALRFAPFLELAILSVPIFMRPKNEWRRGQWFMFSWVFSVIIIIPLNVIFPQLVSPLVANRVVMLIYLPLCALSALTLVSINPYNAKDPIKLFNSKIKIDLNKIFAFSLIIIMAFSFLSYVYSVEYFYLNTQNQSSSDEKNLHNYLGNQPKDAIFLTYSYSMYRDLSSITMHKVYAYYEFSPFSTWSLQILFNTTSSEVAYYLLNQLGITHIVLQPGDLSSLSNQPESAFLQILDYLPITFNNSVATVYEVPESLTESNNYVLVKPLTDVFYNSNPVERSLLASPITSNDLKIVGGANDPFEITANNSIRQTIPSNDIQYLQLSTGQAIHLSSSPIVRFNITGSANAIFNIGFYSDEQGWVWLSKEQGLPNVFYRITNSSFSINLADLMNSSKDLLYVDFVVASNNNLPASIEWGTFDIYQSVYLNEQITNYYNNVYNSFISNSVPVSTIQLSDMANLSSEMVYFLTNDEVTDQNSAELIGNILRGGHVVLFLNPFANTDEFLQTLGLHDYGLIPVSEVNIGNQTVDLHEGTLIRNYTLQDCSYTFDSIGSFSNSTDQIPVMWNFKIGAGALTLVNLPSGKDEIAIEKATNIIIANLTALLPKSISSMILQLPYPSELRNLENPTLININEIPSLSNFIYTYGTVSFTGKLSIATNYVYFGQHTPPISTLIVQTSNSQKNIENVSLSNLHINGKYSVELTAQSAIFFPSGNDQIPYVDLNITSIKISGISDSFNITIEDSSSNPIFSNSSLELIFSNCLETQLSLQMPSIQINNGTLITSWEGVFWHAGKLFSTVSSPQPFPINGSYSCKILSLNDAGLIELSNIQEVDVQVKPTQYWRQG